MGYSSHVLQCIAVHLSNLPLCNFYFVKCYLWKMTKLRSMLEFSVKFVEFIGQSIKWVRIYRSRQSPDLSNLNVEMYRFRDPYLQACKYKTPCINKCTSQATQAKPTSSPLHNSKKGYTYLITIEIGSYPSAAVQAGTIYVL